MLVCYYVFKKCSYVIMSLTCYYVFFGLQRYGGFPASPIPKNSEIALKRAFEVVDKGENT